MNMLWADDQLLFRKGLRKNQTADALCVAAQSVSGGASHG
jgi:hypothetical protein